jgi:D-alanyl-D-alanine carboxypeptidase
MRHRIGDVTKTFTAATAVLLACEGRIDLDKPICTYLPDLLPTDLGMMVTVRMLLNHTSCIADYEPAFFSSAPGVVEGQHKKYTPQDLVKCGLEMTGSIMPGEMFLYSNTNYVILGCLIEKVTGRRYEEEVERRILHPLCLEDTYFPGADLRIRGSHMTAYVPVEGMFCDVTDYDMSYAWAAGALVSSAHDVQRFYAALLGGRLLPPMGLREMLTTVPMAAGNPAAGGYGLGIKCVRGEHSLMWGHDGYAPGHATYAWNSQDGRSVQLFQAENLTWYAGLSGNPADPIDRARAAFQEAACR